MYENMNTKKIDNNKIDSANPIAKILGAISAFAIFSFAVVVYFYFNKLGWWLPSTEEGWAHLGDALGGILGPIFSFFAFIALVLTIALQSRQVELTSLQSAESQKNLESTLAVMERTAAAQSRTSRAMYEQAEFAATSARLTALSALLNVTNEALIKYETKGATGDNEISDMNSLNNRKKVIAKEILSITQELNIPL